MMKFIDRTGKDIIESAYHILDDTDFFDERYYFSKRTSENVKNITDDEISDFVNEQRKQILEVLMRFPEVKSASPEWVDLQFDRIFKETKRRIDRLKKDIS